MVITYSIVVPNEGMGLDKSPMEANQIKEGIVEQGHGSGNGSVLDLELNGNVRILGNVGQTFFTSTALDSKSLVGDGASKGSMANPGILNDDSERMEPFCPHPLSFQIVDVSVSNQDGGLDPAKHSTVSFHINQSPTFDKQHGGDPDEASKKGRSTKNTHGLGAFASGSKIPKNIKIAHGNGRKFKSGSNQRTLLKDSMA